MKINKREKFLLGILLLAALGYLFYNFVYTSNEEKIADLEAELEVKNQQVEELMATVDGEKNLNIEFKELNFEISDMSKTYLPDLDQEKLIVFIDEKLEEFNVNTLNIGFNDDSIINFNSKQESETQDYRYRLEELRDVYYNVEKETSPEVEGKVQTASLENYKFNINFNADYYDLLDFINEMQNNQFEVTISNLNLALGEENVMNGAMTMDIFSIPKLHEHDFMNWVWADYIDSGRSNPFYESDVQRDQYYTTRYDFVMNVKPISSDLPTVTLGEEDDIARDSYVYADSNSVETVDIEVMKESGVYYYRYRTNMYSYPENYEEWVEFEPENDYISMQITSEERTGSDDTSGAILNIVNDTDVIFYVNVVGEDVTNPRIQYTESDTVVFRINE